MAAANAEEEHRRTTTTTTPGESSADAYRRISIPTCCHSAVSRLRRELRLGSDLDVIPWLLEQLQSQTDLVLSGVATCSSPATTSDPPICGNFVPRPISPPRQLRTRVTVAQASTVFFDTPATLEKAEQLISIAAANSSQLVVFPEAFVGGYPGFLVSESSLNNDDELKRMYRDSAIALPGPEVERLAQMARKYNINVVMGVVERAGADLFSVVIFFDSLGRRLGHNRKMLIQVPSEAPVWSPGENIPMLPLYGTSSAGKIGGLISSDNRLPLVRNGLYQKGIEVYCAPTAEANEAWKASMIHIAMEGNCFVLSANQFIRRRDCKPPPPNNNGDNTEQEASSQDNEVVSPGGSIIVSPSGEIVTPLHSHGEYLLSADVELGDIRRENAASGGVRHGFGPAHAGWTVDAAVDQGCCSRSV